MTDTDTSKKTRAESEAEIRTMRKGGPDEETSPGKRGGRKLVLLVLAVLALAGGGAGAMLFVEKPAKTESAPPVAKIERPAPLDPATLIYIDLDPLFIPFRTEAGDAHKIVVVLSLEVGRARYEDKLVRSLLPRLREAYVRTLTSRPFPGTEDGSIETVYLKNRLRAENNRVLGVGVVNDVLVRDIRVVPG